MQFRKLLSLILFALAVPLCSAQTTAVSYAGVYSSGTTYIKSAIVKESGTSYVSQVAGNVGHDPATDDGTHWVPIYVPSVASSSSPGTVVLANGSTNTTAENASNKGAPSGYASLDSASHIPSAQLSPAAVVASLGYTPAQTPTLLGDLATGILADYNFSDGSGTALSDISGSGHDGTLGTGTGAPAWVQGGLQFTYESNLGVSLPVALNAAKTFVIEAYWSPVTTNPACVNQSTPGSCSGSAPVYNTAAYASWISSSLGSAGINLTTKVPGGAGLGAPAIWNSSIATAATNGQTGLHTWMFVLGTGSGNLDHIYVDGIEVGYNSQGSTAGAQSSGNLYIGTSGTGPWMDAAPEATFYRMRVYSTQLTASDAVAIANVFRADAQSRGVPITPLSPLLPGSQFHCIGDSITGGTSLSSSLPYCNLLSLTNQPTYTFNNWGVAGEPLQSFSASEPNRVAPLCLNNGNGPSVANILGGVNDFNQGATPAQVYAALAAEVQALHRGGCKVFVSTLLSATGQDSNKNTYNNLIRTGIRAAGADGISDMAADPVLGADGAYSNTTYFNSGLHPTDTGEPHLAAAVQNAVNYYFGASESNPTVVSATTYTMAAGDGYVTLAPTAATTVTLPSCIGQSGAIYRISNPQSTYTITLKTAASTQPIDGTDYSSSGFTVPATAVLTLRDIPNAPSVSGCHWEK